MLYLIYDIICQFEHINEIQVDLEGDKIIMDGKILECVYIMRFIDSRLCKSCDVFAGKMYDNIYVDNNYCNRHQSPHNIPDLISLRVIIAYHIPDILYFDCFQF